MLLLPPHDIAHMHQVLRNSTHHIHYQLSCPRHPQVSPHVATVYTKSCKILVGIFLSTNLSKHESFLKLEGSRGLREHEKLADKLVTTTGVWRNTLYPTYSE